jgi:hypothetical protein
MDTKSLTDQAKEVMELTIKENPITSKIPAIMETMQILSEKISNAPELIKQIVQDAIASQQTQEVYEEQPEEAYEEQPEEAYEEQPQEAYEEQPEEAYEEQPEEAYEEQPEEAYEEQPEEAYEEQYGGSLPISILPKNYQILHSSACYKTLGPVYITYDRNNIKIIPIKKSNRRQKHVLTKKLRKNNTKKVSKKGGRKTSRKSNKRRSRRS